jgi:acyl dehydratase
MCSHSTFFEYSRLYTSAPFAQLLGFKSSPLPQNFLLGHAVSMSHLDATRDVLDLGFENATYIVPVYSGDTIKKSFYLKSMKNTSNGSTILTVGCQLFNQHGQLVYMVDKFMLFKVKFPLVCFV